MLNLPELNSQLASVVVLNRYVEGGYEPEVGICNATHEIEGVGVYHLVDRAAETWPAYSGHSGYPVPVENVRSPEYGYSFGVANRSLWKDQQGFLRRSLLRHTIDQAVLEAGIY